MINKLYCRLHQQIFNLASYFVLFREPKIFKGQTAFKQLTDVLSVNQKILIITDNSLISLGLLDTLIFELDFKQISYVIYDNILPNPTVTNVEEALAIYKSNNCSIIIAFGGGSPIDCAKIVAARVVQPNKSILKMKGIQKIRKKLIPLFIVPTTSGTGSEITIAAVITDDKTHQKYAISDMCLIPKYIVMDYTLTYKLPKFITATTGMDALTHAIEAFIGKSNTKQTKNDALSAIKLIHENLYVAYLDGYNAKARESMQYASFYAGKAFTRAYVGNVHAIAHTLGGTYNIPHGYANAVALPIVLKAYGSKAEKRLAIIADYIGLSQYQDNDHIKTNKLISWIEEMNDLMKIPKCIIEINEVDIPKMAKVAYHEANPTYPVPDIWSISKFEEVLLNLKGDNNE